jgi:hypothetical protein
MSEENRESSSAPAAGSVEPPCRECVDYGKGPLSDRACFGCDTQGYKNFLKANDLNQVEQSNEEATT